MASSSKRVARELSEITNDPVPGTTISLVNETDLHAWKVLMDGPKGSPYEGGKFELRIDLPTEYPFKAPNVKFVTKIYHPNVENNEKGAMCLGITRGDEWKPSRKIHQVVAAAHQLLIEPLPDDAVDTDAAEAYKNNRPAFIKRAKEDTEKYAKAK